jgi:alkylation response protein AidB-like acyl-CoA dehydrogenase
MTNDDERIESAELRAYRQQVRTWLAENAQRYEGPDPDLDTNPSPERIAWGRAMQAKLHDAGYAGFTYPVEYGGQGLTLDHERVFREEIAGYDIPTRMFGVSINILGATIAQFGTHEQKDQHLRKILRGEELWLQLLSEPSGGSDLAGLLTSATRDGDRYVVNGQKTWSTGAHWADFALCPVSTSWDVPKHRGISVLMLDLRTPGVKIRPIKEITGEAHFCDEFLTDVLVPVSNLHGEENGGWSVLRGLLAIEHSWVGRGGAKRSDFRDDVSDIVDLARRQGVAGDPGVRRSVTALHVMLRAQKLVSGRISHGVATHQLDHNLGGALKIGNDVLAQRCNEAALAIAGTAGVAWDPGDRAAEAVSHGYLISRSAPIAGGTAEIVRNNVSEKALGLPREPTLDRDLPFNQVPHN